MARGDGWRAGGVLQPPAGRALPVLTTPTA
jgi:hypothetical protein